MTSTSSDAFTQAEPNLPKGNQVTRQNRNLKSVKILSLHQTEPSSPEINVEETESQITIESDGEMFIDTSSDTDLENSDCEDYTNLNENKNTQKLEEQTTPEAKIANLTLLVNQTAAHSLEVEDRLNRRISGLQSEIQVLYELVTNYSSLIQSQVKDGSSEPKIPVNKDAKIPENPDIATSHLLMSLSNARASQPENSNSVPIAPLTNMRIPSLGAQVAFQNIVELRNQLASQNTLPPGYNYGVQTLPSLRPILDQNTRISTDQLFDRPTKRRYTESEATTPSYRANMPKAKRRRGNLPMKATSHLRTWLFSHRDKPYPSEEEKADLVDATGLTLVQINNWFSNARRRILNKKEENDEAVASF